ncbi:MAG: hypothetical protein AUJ98_08195 [Bacteroidetes bacterium CG2_30_33_31]|nr:MAG: hypothetical protein AUJ98_08195 [Bacteroidetes bacterium CG2_30_33_31]
MKNISLKDVAESLGVSTTLVSFVVNGKAKQNGISKATENRVRQKVLELGYHANNFARILRTGKSNTIGVVVSDISNAYFARICRNIEDYASKEGYNVIFCSSDENCNKENAQIKMLIEKGIDGIILAPTNKTSDAIDEINKLEIPIILIDRYYPNSNFNYVISDNYIAAQKITQYLVGLGHRNIGFLAMSPTHTSLMTDRIKGYKDCLKKNGIKFNNSWLITLNIKELDGEIYDKMSGFLDPENNITAIISTNNRVTVAAIDYINRNGKKIPEDLSLITFGFLDVYKIIRPPITAVQLFAEKIGDKAAEMLLSKLSNNKIKIKNVIIDTLMHERESCKRI